MRWIKTDNPVPGMYYAEIVGDSNDQKPTSNIITGSLFTETDTAIVYIFNERDSQWHVLCDLGGGY